MKWLKIYYCIHVAVFCLLLKNLDLSFAYSYVLCVLYSPLESVPHCQQIPNTQSPWFLSLSVLLAHINMPLSLVLPLLSLIPSHPATPLAAAWFLFNSNVLLAFVVSKCCQLSPLPPGPLAIYSPCPPRASLMLLLSLSFDPVFSIILHPPLYLALVLFCASFIFSFYVPSLIFSLPQRRY